MTQIPHFLEFLRENAGGEGGSPTNVTAGAEGLAKPIFTASRFGGRAEYLVPHDVYDKAKNGRNRGDRWDSFIENKELQAAVRKSLYEEGACLITSEMTGAAVYVRHNKMVRMRYEQETSGV